MPVQFHAPPGWPQTPPDFIPSEGWRPAEHWGAAPPSWVFYTESGQPTASPPGAWNPHGPGGAAAPQAEDDTSRPSWRRPVNAPDVWVAQEPPVHPAGQRPENAARPGGAMSRPVRLLIIGAAAAVVVLAVVLGLLNVVGREPVVTATQFDSLLPDGTRVGGISLGDGDAAGTGGGDYLSGNGMGGTCLDDLLGVAGADAEGLSTGGGSLGVDPATGMVAGNALHVWANRLGTVDDAKARYQKLQRSREQSDCFTGSEQQQLADGELIGSSSRSPRWEAYGTPQSSSLLLAQRGNIVFLAFSSSTRGKEDMQTLAAELTARVDLLGDE